MRSFVAVACHFYRFVCGSVEWVALGLGYPLAAALLVIALPLLVAACRRRCCSMPRIMAVNSRWANAASCCQINQFDLFVWPTARPPTPPRLPLD